MLVSVEWREASKEADTPSVSTEFAPTLVDFRDATRMIDWVVLVASLLGSGAMWSLDHVVRGTIVIDEKKIGA